MVHMLPTCSVQTAIVGPRVMQMYKVPRPLWGPGSQKRLQEFMETGASQVPGNKVPSTSNNLWRMFTQEYLGGEVSPACPVGSTCARHSLSIPTRRHLIPGGFAQPAS